MGHGLGEQILLNPIGIGDPNVLRRFDIPLKIDLPGVGENLQVSIMSASLLETTDVNTVPRTMSASRSALCYQEVMLPSKT